MTVVCDASALVALLVDAGPEGDWVATQIDGEQVAAPCLVDFEVVNVLRRHSQHGVLADVHAEAARWWFGQLHLERWPFEALAARIWELRGNATVYDAGYMALAERLSAPLLTLDARLARTPGIRCSVRCPPGA